MEKNSQNPKVFSNFLWKFAERCGAQGVSFIVQIVLARILMPEVYGTVALITVFTNILQIFVDSGMGCALIQKKNADDLDFSSVFFFNIFMCSILYLGMFIFAPLIADFYENPELTPLIRVLSLTIVVSGVRSVQQAYVSRTMQFKRFFFSTIGGTIGGAIIGIVLAYSGYGVWALVCQQVFIALFDTIILWFTVKWRPKLMFSIYRLKTLFNFGWKLLVSSLIETGYTELRQLIIGKMYSSADLGYYNRAETFPKVIVTNIDTSINSVLLPTMSREQDNKHRVKEMARRAIKTSTYIMAPLMMGLAFAAEPIVRLILTDKWLECVPYLQIFCVSYMFFPIHTANLNAINAMGRSDIFLKLEIIKKIVGLTAIFISMWFGVMAMAYSMLVVSVIGQIINSYPNKKLLDYGYISQLKDILPQILLAVFMGVCIYPVALLGLHDILTILIQVVVGAGIYLLGSIVFKFDSLPYLLEAVKKTLKKA